MREQYVIYGGASKIVVDPEVVRPGDSYELMQWLGEQFFKDEDYLLYRACFSGDQFDKEFFLRYRGTGTPVLGPNGEKIIIRIEEVK